MKEQRFDGFENSQPLQIANTAKEMCSTDEIKVGTVKSLLRHHKVLSWCIRVSFDQEKKGPLKNLRDTSYRFF